MKNLEELTEAELLELSFEEVELITDLACAEQGIPLLPPHPGARPVVDKLSPDTVMYKVLGVGFKTLEDANEAVEFLADYDLVESSYRNGSYYLKDVDKTRYHGLCVIREELFTKGLLDSTQEARELVDKKVKQWEALNNGYKDIEERRKGVVSYIHSTILNVQERSDRREALKAKYDRYLTLAEGNKAVAYKFLNLVESLGDFPELVEAFNPPAGAQEVSNDE